MNSIGSNESEGDGSTAQSHQTAVSPSMGEPGNHPAIHPPTHENSEEISTAIDETWDLRSPLMPRLAQGEEQESSSDESNLPLELEEPIEENVAFDPLRVSLMLCAMIMTMLFCGLVTGSFFFPWSDTTFRLQMDTTDSLPFDISVPLYTDAKFSDTLSIFKQSHSNMLVVLMILSTIIAPSFWMLSQVLILYSINGDPQKEVSDTTRTFSRLKRFIGLPLFATKFSMSIVYVNSILLVATSNVRLAIGGDYSPEMQEIKRSKPTNNNGDFIFAEIENVTRGGLVAYVVGTTLGTGAFMLFQHLCCTSSSNDESTAQPQPSAQTGETHVPNNTITNDGDKSILSPPPMAFRISLNYEEIPREDGLVADSSMNESTEEDYRELSTPLMSRMRNNDQPVEEEIAFEMDQPHNDSLHSMDLRAGQRCKFRWRDILEFEAGVLSFLFFFLFADQPLIQLNYSGLLTPVFNELTSESIQLTLIDIIDIVTAKGGKGIFPFVTTSLLWINVILVPLLVWLSCTTALLLKTFSNHDNSRYINLARKCHPLSHITPFALSICVSLGSMNQVSNFLFSENIFCPIVRDLAAVDGSSQCLQISASLKPAAFLLFINTMSIDLYLYLVNST